MLPDQINDSDPDSSRMRLIAGGDFSAMRDLVERWQKPLINFFYRSVNSVHTAEDLAQATFVKIFKNAGTYEAKAKFPTWLFCVARSVLISNFRKESVRPVAFAAPEDLANIGTSGEDGHVAELEQAFSEAVKTLPEKQRSAILLLCQQGLSYEEIADAMEASIPNVKTWIFRARQALKEKLSVFLEK